MLTLKDLSKIKCSMGYTFSIDPPIFYPSEEIYILNNKQDEVYDFMKKNYCTNNGDFFKSHEDYWVYHRRLKLKAPLRISKTLKTYTDLMTSFMILAGFIYDRVNLETRAKLEKLFRDFQNNCNRSKMILIILDLKSIIKKDKFLDRFKLLILKHKPVIEYYELSKTNKSRLDAKALNHIKNMSKSYIKHQVKTSSEIIIETIKWYDRKKEIVIIKKNTVKLMNKSLRGITHKFRKKELNKYFGVIKLLNLLKADLHQLYCANEVMKIYWNDERSLSYGNQASKVSGRIYRLIQRYNDKSQDQLTHLQQDLLKLTKLEITKIVNESFELSIYPR